MGSARRETDDAVAGRLDGAGRGTGSRSGSEKLGLAEATGVLKTGEDEGPAQPAATTMNAAVAAVRNPRSAMIVPYPKKPANRCPAMLAMNSILPADMKIAPISRG